MSSVIDDMKCPQCGGIMFCDFNCRTGEEYRLCRRCGKQHNWHFERDGANEILLDENNDPIMNETELFGYGCICLEFKKGAGQIISLNSLPKSEDVDTFFKYLEDNADIIEKDGCYFTYWDEETEDIKSHFGTIPSLYEELDNIGEENHENES